MSLAQFLTAKQVAERWGCGVANINALIVSRRLPAIDIAASERRKRATWRIRLDDVETFEAARTTKPPATPEPRARRAIPDVGAVTFFRNGTRV